MATKGGGKMRSRWISMIFCVVVGLCLTGLANAATSNFRMLFYDDFSQDIVGGLPGNPGVGQISIRGVGYSPPIITFNPPPPFSIHSGLSNLGMFPSPNHLLIHKESDRNEPFFYGVIPVDPQDNFDSGVYIVEWVSAASQLSGSGFAALA